MSIEQTIARPYARAIFDIAVNTNSIQEWKEILSVINMIASNQKIRRFLSGSLSPKYLSSIFIKVSSDLIHKHSENLIKLLAKNQRFKILHNISEQFLELEAHYKEILIVELRTACLLEEKKIINIRRKLEKYFLRKIQFIYKIDAHILDGMIIKVNDTVFDLSVRSYLTHLSDFLNR